MPALTPTERVLDAAERLFLERGYGGTRLRDLAEDLGMKPASLYHHAPGGKRELWHRVVDRALERHRRGLQRAATDGEGDLRRQLGAMIRYLLEQPPVNVVHLASASAPPAAETGVEPLAERLYRTMMLPIREVYGEAQAQGRVSDRFPVDLFAGVFLSAANGLVAAHHAGSLPADGATMAAEVTELLLRGVE